MREIIRRFDALLSRWMGVLCLGEREDCLLRVQVARATRRLRFPDAEVQEGQPVLALHLWNEHLPPVPPGGPDLIWASRVRRLFVRSLADVAGWIESDPRLADVRAVGGTTALFPPGGRSSGAHLMRRLGFTVCAPPHPLGRFGELMEYLYSRALIWAYNPASLRRRRAGELRRSEFWMPRAEFLRRYRDAQKPAEG